EQPVLGGDEALGEEQVVAVPGVDVRDAPPVAQHLDRFAQPGETDLALELGKDGLGASGQRRGQPGRRLTGPGGAGDEKGQEQKRPRSHDPPPSPAPYPQPGGQTRKKRTATWSLTGPPARGRIKPVPHVLVKGPGNGMGRAPSAAPATRDSESSHA